MNLLATGVAGEVIGRRKLMLPPAVAAAIYVFGDDAQTTKIAIDGELIARAGLVVEHTALTVVERDAFVAYTEDVDDGEAQVIAIAVHRGLHVLTDDNGGMRLARGLGVPIITTLDLMHSCELQRI